MTDETPGSVHVTSHNQSGGITAQVVNLAPEPRSATPEVVDRLVQTLAGRSLAIWSTSGNRESWQYAEDLSATLVARGIKASHAGYVQMMSQPPPPEGFWAKETPGYDLTYLIGCQ